MINLPGIGFLGASLAPRIATYRDKDNITTTQSIFNFAGLAIGPAYADRRILVAITARGSTTTGVISSVTVGGIAAPVIAQLNNTAGSNLALTAFAIADVPTGTTAAVVVTFSTSKTRCGIAVYDISGLETDTPIDVQSAIAGTPPNIAVLEGSCVIGVAFSASNATFSWSGISEDYDVQYGGNAYSGGSGNGFLVGTTPWNSTISGGSDTAKLAVSF